MRFPCVRTAIGAVCLLISFCSLDAQQATVIHGVSLRGDPSTQNPPIGHLQRNSTVTLLAPKPKTGFYHVKTADGTQGWVGVKYLTVESGAVPQPTPSSPDAPTLPAVGSTGCDVTLWTHVYNPQRLIVKQKCITVTGTIVDATNGKKSDGVRHEPDGDTHGWLKVDPGFENLLNAGNSAEGGNLVFEIVCKFPVTQADAKAACPLTYHTPVQLPAVGSHVSVVGSYVQDSNHAKWMEIHPVTKITVIQ